MLYSPVLLNFKIYTFLFIAGQQIKYVHIVTCLCEQCLYKYIKKFFKHRLFNMAEKNSVFYVIACLFFFFSTNGILVSKGILLLVI